MSSPSTNSRRAAVNNGLVGIAFAGGALSTILALLVFISGTSISHDGGGSGSSHLQLKDLALVSFDGVIPNNDTSQFLVHLRWFISSLAWEYPDAPDGLPQAGFASKGLHFSSDVVGDLRKIAVDLKLPEESYYCPQLGSSAKQCTNVFYEAWRSYLVLNGLSILIWLIWIMLISAIFNCLLSIAQEWMIRKRPYWMRCRCIIGKRYCPYPTGSKEEIENLDGHYWDKVRMSYWALTAGYFALPAIQSTFISWILLEYIGAMEKRLPRGISMNAKREMKAEIFLWFAFVTSAMSVLCMLVKWRMSRQPKGWVEEQNSSRLERYTD